MFKKLKRAKQNLTTQIPSKTAFSDPNGIEYGLNKNTDNPVIIDNFDFKRRPNGNVMLVGTRGAGVPTTLLDLSLKLHANGVHNYVITPDPDFKRIFNDAADEIGGKRVRIWPGSPDNINIMEIRKRDNTASDGAEEPLLATKIQRLYVFMEMLLPDITAEESQLLDKAIMSCYGKLGITMDDASLEDPGQPGVYKQMPIIGDLYNELKLLGEKAERLVNSLSQFVVGEASSFNGPTNINLDNSFTVLDVGNAWGPYREICTFIATDFVWDKVQENRNQKDAIVFDRLQLFDSTPASECFSKFALDIFKMVPRFNSICIAANHSEDLVGDTGTKAIIKDGCALLCIKRLKQDEAIAVQQAIGIEMDADLHRKVDCFTGSNMLLIDKGTGERTFLFNVNFNS